MELDKQEVVNMIRSKMGDEKAQQADSELPDKVDPDKHADLLNKHGLDPSSLLGGLGS